MVLTSSQGGLTLDLPPVRTRSSRTATAEALEQILSEDLGFKGQAPNHSAHTIHAFAAKFPPQLPLSFIEALTSHGDLVCDPMAGSGTALLEAARCGRRGIGFDMDPLAVKLSLIKTRRVEEELALAFAEGIADWARSARDHKEIFDLDSYLDNRYHEDARAFFEYWFEPETIQELGALVQGIRSVAPKSFQALYEVILSSVIVTKSGGVSRARDLAHSRPHRVDDKVIRNAVDVFWQRASKIIPSLASLPEDLAATSINLGDSRALPLGSMTVDLIVTSPPYANAIDYMRAHKFSLMWLGAMLPDLTRRRKEYIGAEVGRQSSLLASRTAIAAITAVEKLDPRRSKVLKGYFTDMRAAIGEMYRVLKPGKGCVIVVGSSTIRGHKIDTPFALAEEAESLGFKIVNVKEREIDRDKRLMPTSFNGARIGIQARMHDEHVLGLVRPL